MCKGTLLAFNVIVLLPAIVLGIEPCNPNASGDARKLLKWLDSLPSRETNRLVAGHYFNGTVRQGIDTNIKPIYDRTGKWLALAASDFIWWNSENADENIGTLTDWWKAGGLVMLSWHIRNPANPAAGYGGSCDIKEALSAGTGVNQRYMNSLAKVAEWLAQLRERGVVILWRPFHEMNQGFWWGKKDKSEFIKLWIHMFRYYTEEKGLNNLIWVYAPNVANYPGYLPEDYYYPGADYVDVVAMDYYGKASLNDIPSGYSKLEALGKPFGISELGSYGDSHSVIDEIRSKCPKATFVVPWYGKFSFISHGNVEGLVNDPWVITRDEVDWRTSAGGGGSANACN
ncbi:MAG: glycosyl hydrolase [Thermogutta sp.]